MVSTPYKSTLALSDENRDALAPNAVRVYAMSMRLANSYFVLTALVNYWALAGCSSSSPKATATIDNGSTGGASSCSDASATQVPFGDFTINLVPASQGARGSGENPAYVDIVGQIYDGPSPEPFIETMLPAPPDATPGCAVYAESTPSCANIGGCGIGSSDAACAGTACICVATDTCQAYPIKKNAGTVTVSGIAETSGAKAFQLVNVSNSYQEPDTLAYPGFAEGDTITISSACGDYAPFEISAKGVSPLKLTNGPPFTLLRDSASADPTQYQAFTITWDPPGSAGDGGAHVDTRIQVVIDLAHHAGSVGHLACDVEDNGSLTISAGQISQLSGLGNIAGYPELDVIRSTSTTLETARGEVNLAIESSIIAPDLRIDGYISCTLASDCPSGQMCNSAKKLCQPG